MLLARPYTPQIGHYWQDNFSPEAMARRRATGEFRTQSGANSDFKQLPKAAGIPQISTPLPFQQPQMPMAQSPRFSINSDQRRPWEGRADFPFMGLSSLGRAIRPLNGMNYDWFS
jgi:hypothetical protein